jgi:hypothetical protein
MALVPRRIRWSLPARTAFPITISVKDEKKNNFRPCCFGNVGDGGGAGRDKASHPADRRPFVQMAAGRGQRNHVTTSIIEMYFGQCALSGRVTVATSSTNNSLQGCGITWIVPLIWPG